MTSFNLVFGASNTLSPIVRLGSFRDENSLPSATEWQAFGRPIFKRVDTFKSVDEPVKFPVRGSRSNSLVFSELTNSALATVASELVGLKSSSGLCPVLGCNIGWFTTIDEMLAPTAGISGTELDPK